MIQQLKSGGTRVRSTTVSALILIAASSYTAAQPSALEEVIVTATKRTQSLQDVPVSVTAFSDQVIQEAGINNAADLATLTPSLTITVNAQPGTAAFRIRGIGTSQSDISLEPSVGLFVDDVYLNRSGLGMSDLTDIERIEVLHGPQGTLYGKNTNAGAVSIFTKLPNSEEFEGYVEATAGNYDLAKLTVSASAPISDTLAYRVSGNVHKRDGYLENSAGKDLNAADDWNIIAKLLYQPNDSFRFLLKGSHVDRDTRCCAADSVQTDLVNAELMDRGLPVDRNDPFDYKIAVDVENVFETTADAMSLVMDYDFQAGSIKSITAWNQSEGNTSQDADRSQLDILFFDDSVSDGNSFSQELRFSSEEGGQLDYQLGLFYFESTTNGGKDQPYVFLGEDVVTIGSQQPNIGLLVVAGSRPGDSLRAKVKLESQSVALFGQSTWHFSERWRVTGGLRWTDEDKDADLFVDVDSTAPSTALPGSPSLLATFTTRIDDDFSRNSSDVNWLVNTSFDVHDDTMVFASIATGSKSGGFQTVNGTPDQREFDDESTISYELGVKSTLLDARLRLNAAAFYSKIDDYQFQQQLETGLGTRVSNEAQVETSGIDFDVQALPLPNLTLTASLLYMHKYEVTDGPQKGDKLHSTAKYSGTLAATLVFPLADGGVYIRGDYSYMDDHFTGGGVERRELDIQDRNLFNAKLGWRNDHWNISVWGKNLTEDEYAGLTPATFILSGMDAYFLTAPRIYGATLRYDF